MPDPHRTPAGITRRALDRVLAATRQAEDQDHNNYNVTRPPAPHDQRGDRAVFPVQVTGSEDGTLAGMWPAKVRYWSGYAGGTPVNFADQPGVAACWAFPAPGGEDLTNTGEYLGAFVGIHTDGKAVFEVMPAAGTSLNSQNTDGTEIDSTTTDVRFDKSTGSKITQSGGVSTHTLLAASATQMGAVTVGAQTVGGRKKSATAAGSRAAWVAESSQAEGAPDSPTSRWTPFVASYTGTTPAYTGGMTIDVFAASASDFPDSQLAVGQIVTQFRAEHGDLIGTTEDRTIAGLYATLAPGGSGPVRYFAVGDPMNEAGVNEFPHAFGCFRLGYLKQGIDASTTGLTVPGTVVGGIVTATRTLSIAAGDVSGLAAVATSGDYADITGGPPATTTVSLSYDAGTNVLTVTVNGVSDTIDLSDLA